MQNTAQVERHCTTRATTHGRIASRRAADLLFSTATNSFTNAVRGLQWIGRARGSLSAPFCLHFVKPLPQCCFFLLARREHIRRVRRAMSTVEVLVMSAVLDGDCYDSWIGRNVLHNAAR